MHGLRKALGVKLAEADASTRQLMEMLGHSNIAYAELYSREASQIRLAMQAMDKVTEIEEARRRPNLTIVK
jgi:site-specific recombinase XerD